MLRAAPSFGFLIISTLVGGRCTPHARSAHSAAAFKRSRPEHKALQKQKQNKNGEAGPRPQRLEFGTHSRPRTEGAGRGEGTRLPNEAHEVGVARLELEHAVACRGHGHAQQVRPQQAKSLNVHWPSVAREG